MRSQVRSKPAKRDKESQIGLIRRVDRSIKSIFAVLLILAGAILS